MNKLPKPQGRSIAIRNHLPDMPVIGAEVGVFRGGNARDVLRLCPQIETLNLCDYWGNHQSSPKKLAANYKGTGDPHAVRDDKFWETTFGNLSTIIGKDNFKRCKTHRGLSTELAKTFEDGSLDFIFIDANHSYEAVRDDIAAWYPKLKREPHAWIGGHDYKHPRNWKGLYGVNRAVNEFVKRENIHIQTGRDFTWFAFPMYLPYMP